MPGEPLTKTAIAFVDGQNLFRSAKTAFGRGHPNYDVQALASAVCSLMRWQLVETRFYTGVPAARLWYLRATAPRRPVLTIVNPSTRLFPSSLRVASAKGRGAVAARRGPCFFS